MIDQKIYCSKIDRDIDFSSRGLPNCSYYEVHSTKCNLDPASKLIYCLPYNNHREQSIKDAVKTTGLTKKLD